MWVSKHEQGEEGTHVGTAGQRSRNPGLMRQVSTYKEVHQIGKNIKNNGSQVSHCWRRESLICYGSTG